MGVSGKGHYVYEENIVFRYGRGGGVGEEILDFGLNFFCWWVYIGRCVDMYLSARPETEIWSSTAGLGRGWAWVRPPIVLQRRDRRI
jgi:hypothetical protein